ncbi:MAG: amidohydrolase family protein [Thermoplasmata archaeon]
MPPPDWVLAGRGLVKGRLQPIEIGIGEDGTIVALGRDLRAPERHDVGEGIVLPSATDLHVHFRDPGGTARVENFATGTIEAALGGVGLVADMPNTLPAVTDASSFEEKRKRVTGRAAVDVLLFGALTTTSKVDELAKVAGALKLYLSPTTGVPAPPRNAEIPDLLRRAAVSGLPLTVHAEDPAQFRSEPPAKSLTEWDRARPETAEAAAVEGVITGAPRGLRLHFAHVTNAGIAERITRAGHSFEASPHHLLLSRASKLGPRAKVNPPLRSDEERARLWKLFAQGGVPCLASDHAPHDASAKDVAFELAPSGMPNVETMLPLLLAKVRDGNLELPRLVAAAMDRPSRWIGQPRGRIALGHRADMIVVDFRDRRTIAAKNLHAPCGWSAFEGHEGIFPREHYRAGERIVLAGEYIGTPTGVLRRPEFVR